jgi:hypothetical protein
MLKYCWFFNAPEYCNYDDVDEGENSISQNPVISNPDNSDPVNSDPSTINPDNSDPATLNLDLNLSPFQMIGVGSASIGVHPHPDNNTLGISIAINSTFSTAANTTIPSIINQIPIYQPSDTTTESTTSSRPTFTTVANIPETSSSQSQTSMVPTSATSSPSTSSPTTSNPTNSSSITSNQTTLSSTTSKPTTLTSFINSEPTSAPNSPNNMVFINSDSTLNPFPIFTTPTPTTTTSASVSFLTTEKVKHF